MLVLTSLRDSAMSRLHALTWRTRLKVLSLFVGCVCGLVCAVYEVLIGFLLELVWKEQLPAALKAHVPSMPEWTYIIVICTVFGFSVGVFIHLLGEPTANLPGVVQEFYTHGKLDHREAPAMIVISQLGILGGGSLGPEAPLVSIGGGFASLVCHWLELSRAETIFITLAGMGAGLAAFFGEPVGGAIFACEMIHRYGLEYYEAFIPTVISGTACNFVFRYLLNLPQKAIWTIPPESASSTLATLHGVMLGVVGGLIGRVWIDMTNWTRVNVLLRNGLGKCHILKGSVGGLLIGLIGAVLPPTLFWAEYEAQSLLDGGVTPLHHIQLASAFGPCDLTNLLVLTSIGCMKLVAISITVLAGYRGGFIFPFYFCGIAFGVVIHRLVPGLSLATAALSLAAAINTSVTRTVLATPVVLIGLSGRPDVLPCVLVASVVSLYMTGDVAIIKASRARRKTQEILGQVISSSSWTIDSPERRKSTAASAFNFDTSDSPPTYQPPATALAVDVDENRGEQTIIFASDAAEIEKTATADRTALGLL